MADSGATAQPNDQPFSCLYFGFASNLSPRTIKQRCPSAMYAGLATLKGYKFVISSLGFGNIIPSADPSDIVYGGLNFLSRRDEEALDKSEEVPEWHSKVNLTVTRVGAADQEVEVMTYVDVARLDEGIMSKDYIVWVRKAMEDGKKCGVPESYFEKYWSRFLPEDDTVGKEDQILMIRTMQIDREDTRNVPSYMLKSEDKGE